MMHGYKFKRSTYGDKYTFDSVGTKGCIKKAVLFDMEEDGLYSVVLGDLNEKGQLKSFRPTGNGDAKKVLATVANIIYFFLVQNPKAILFFSGTTKRLTNVYKKLLLREKDLSSDFIIEGVNSNNTTELIDPEKQYEGFFIFRKKP